MVQGSGKIRNGKNGWQQEKMLPPLSPSKCVPWARKLFYAIHVFTRVFPKDFSPLLDILFPLFFLSLYKNPVFLCRSSPNTFFRFFCAKNCEREAGNLFAVAAQSSFVPQGIWCDREIERRRLVNYLASPNWPIRALGGHGGVKLLVFVMII